MQFRKKINKVMLLFPTGKVLKWRFHHCEIPMGLAYLAAVLRNDFDVKVLDGRAKFQRMVPKNSKWEYFGFTPKEIVEQVKTYSPDVVGISCLSSFHFPDVVDLFERVKKIDNDIITVTGGTHPTFLADEVMKKHSSIDFIVMGEGEDTFYQLLMNINSEKEYDALDGLAFRNNGTYQINPKTKYIEDLDALPYPAFDLFPLDFYEKKSIPFSVTFRSKKTIPILTSRGCSAQCIFCASKNYWGKRYRMRTAENVLDEIEYMVKKYGVEEIQFIDDNLTLDKNRARKIFQGLIDRNINIHWNTPNGIAVWTLDEQMLKLMKASGCYELTVAFESGDQEVLNNIIKKPLDLKYAKKMVNKMKDLDIQVHSFFISGFPGETKEQIKRSFAFAKTMDLDSAWFFVANPTPGSELYEICKNEGYINDDFSFENIEYSLSHIKNKEFTPREMEKLIITQFNNYNLGQMVKHPIRFLKKYLGVIISHPIMSLRTILADMLCFIGK
ncbi:MAG: cobalamin-dependent protein [Candidatus Omnitrophica bacterium]|nr:cobalamin-dependent protein [Candidatus Omnitrophota bacterium]